MPPDVAIELDGVGKTYRRGRGRARLRAAVPGQWGETFSGQTHEALSNVTLRVEAGSSFGLIGSNGAGKSTLLKLVAGVLAPTSGRVHVSGRVAALIELGAGLHPDLTGRENVAFVAAMLGMSRKELGSRADEIIDFAEIEAYLDTPVKRYSSGMLARLGFSIAAHLNADVVVLDEVLAVGDEAFQRRCHAKVGELREQGCTTLYVTHSLWTLPLLCDHAAVMENGRLVGEGPPNDMIDLYLEKGEMQQQSKLVTVALSSPSIEPGGPLEAVVRVTPNEDVVTPHLLVSITDLRGVILVGWQVPAEESSTCGAALALRLHLESVPLKPGRYQLNACLTHGPADTVCEGLVSETFHVLGPDHNRSAFGQFLLPATWEWLEEPGDRTQP
jgi:ABC-type polysaccharide/polyol phosphate transport system ATPase subunit